MKTIKMGEPISYVTDTINGNFTELESRIDAIELSDNSTELEELESRFLKIEKELTYLWSEHQKSNEKTNITNSNIQDLRMEFAGESC